MSNNVRTEYVYDGDEPIADYAPSGQVLRQYVNGQAVDERLMYLNYTDNGSGTYTATVSHYYRNHQGSIVALSKATDGTLQYQYTYDAYGNIGQGESGGQPFRYTGRRYDSDTGLYYYRARYYSPKLGRFLQIDPIGYEDNMNMYGYTANDPVNNTDPSGKWGVFGAVYGAIAGGVGGYIASGGSLEGTLAGAVAGALVGAVNPIASNTIGAAAGAGVASYIGQAAGAGAETLSGGGSLADAGGAAVDVLADPNVGAIAGATLGGGVGSVANRAIAAVVAPSRAGVIGTLVGQNTLTRPVGNTLGSVVEGALTGAGEAAGAFVSDTVIPAVEETWDAVKPVVNMLLN